MQENNRWDKGVEPKPKVFDSFGAGRFQIENRAEGLTPEEQEKQKEQQQQAEEKRRERLKKGFRIGIYATVLAVVAIVIVGFVMDIIGRDRVVLELGEFSFRESDVNAYVNAIEEHMRNNPDTASFGENLTKVALNDLIFNTSLKYYASSDNCNISVTAEDVAGINAIQLPGGVWTAETILNARWGEFSKSNFFRVRLENEAYRVMLSDCLIAKKEIFWTRIYLEAGYFLFPIMFEETEFLQEAFPAARDRLENEFLPLFEVGMSSEEIALRADRIRNMGDIDFDDVELLDTQAVVDAARMGYVVDDIVPALVDHGAPGEPVSLRDIVESLNEVGQHTGVMLEGGAAYTIVRLEGMTGGEFLSWDDFLSQMTDKADTRRLLGFDSSNFNALSQSAYAATQNVHCNMGAGTGVVCHGVRMRIVDVTSGARNPEITRTLNATFSVAYELRTQNTRNLICEPGTFSFSANIGENSHGPFVNTKVNCACKHRVSFELPDGYSLVPESLQSINFGGANLRVDGNTVSFDVNGITFQVNDPREFNVSIDIIGPEPRWELEGLSGVGTSQDSITHTYTRSDPLVVVKGQPIFFGHSILNRDGPNATTTINWTVMDSSAGTYTPAPIPRQLGSVSSFAVGQSSTWMPEANYVYTDMDTSAMPHGTLICQYIEFRPRSSGQGGAGRSSNTEVCARVIEIPSDRFCASDCGPYDINGDGFISGTAEYTRTFCAETYWRCRYNTTTTRDGFTNITCTNDRDDQGQLTGWVELYWRSNVYNQRERNRWGGYEWVTYWTNNWHWESDWTIHNAWNHMRHAGEDELFDNDVIVWQSDGVDVRWRWNRETKEWEWRGVGWVREQVSKSNEAKNNCSPIIEGDQGGIKVYVWDNAPGMTNFTGSSPSNPAWLYTEEIPRSTIYLRPGSKVQFAYWADASAWVHLQRVQNYSNCCSGQIANLTNNYEAMNCDFSISDIEGSIDGKDYIPAPKLNAGQGSWNGAQCLARGQAINRDYSAGPPNDMIAGERTITPYDLGKRFRQEGTIYPTDYDTDTSSCTVMCGDPETCSCSYSKTWYSAYKDRGDSWAEAKVPYNYQTKSSISVDPSDATDAQTRTTVSFSIENANRPNRMIIDNAQGYSTDTYPTNYRVVSFLLPPNGSIKTVPADGEQVQGTPSVGRDNVCRYYMNNGNINGSNLSSYIYNDVDLGCINITEGEGVIGANETFRKNFDGIYAHDAPAGTKVCYALTLYPASSWGKTTDNQSTEPANDAATSTSPSNAHRWWSQPKCYTIGKKPKVQILGAGLSVHGNISTSQTIKSFGKGTTEDRYPFEEVMGNPALLILTDTHRRIYGSWSQFEIVAERQVITTAGEPTRMASGAAFGNYGLCLSLGTSCAESAPGIMPVAPGGINEWSRQTITNSDIGNLGNYMRNALATIETRLNITCTPLPADGGPAARLINGCEHRRNPEGSPNISSSESKCYAN